MNNKVGSFDDKLEAMSIAMSEWQRLEHISLEELEANREKYKEPWTVGNYKISVTLGEQGAFTDGQCNTTASGEEKNCFNDTTMTVYDKDGKPLYTTRTLPLSSGDGGGAIGFPDWKTYRYIGSSYAVAPDNGFAYVRYYAPTEHFSYVAINGYPVSIGGGGEGGGEWSGFIPVKKGEVISIHDYWDGPMIYFVGVKK